MSTSNFIPMPAGFPLVCGGLESYDEARAAWDDTEEEFSESMFDSLMELDYYDAENLAEAFSENLKYYTVSIRSGYYYGFQFYVEEKYTEHFDLDPRSRYCLDNDDAHYYFDCCRSMALREAAAEKRKIRRWLLEIAAHNPYEVLECIGIFSNGEAVYRRQTA